LEIWKLIGLTNQHLNNSTIQQPNNSTIQQINNSSKEPTHKVDYSPNLLIFVAFFEKSNI